MIGLIDANGNYYEAEMNITGATEVPRRPSAYHARQNGSWVLNEASALADLRTDKIAKINADRLKANRGTFTFMGLPISCDELSRSDIDGANGIISLTGALPPGWLGAWKTATNEYIPVPDVATWAALYGAMVAQGTENFSKAQTLKAQVEAAYQAGDRAALEAVAW